MKKKKRQPRLTFITLILAMTALGYLSYKLLMPSPKETEILQVTGGSGPISLTLTPASSSVAANTTTDISLNIDTGTGKATAVSVELAYLSGQCVTPITVTKGDFLTVVLVAPTVTSNKIKFTYAAPPDSGGKQGTGTLAKITTGPTTGSCVLSFTSNTLAAAIGSGTNALASASDAAINIQGASPNPSPSIAPSPSLSPALIRFEEVIQAAIDKWGTKRVCKLYGICR